MKKKLSIIIFLIFSLPFLMGMGGNPDDKPVYKIPVVDASYKATITDTKDSEVVGQNISVDGATYFVGKRGDVSVGISFDKVVSAEVKEKNDKEITVVLNLINGNAIKINTNIHAMVYGQSDFGYFRIELKDIKKILFKR